MTPAPQRPAPAQEITAKSGTINDDPVATLPHTGKSSPWDSTDGMPRWLDLDGWYLEGGRGFG